MQRLVSFFSDGLSKTSDSIGMEVETSFLTPEGAPASVQESQSIFHSLVEQGWTMEDRKGPLISVIADSCGNKVLYELGRQNIEVATAPSDSKRVAPEAKRVLEQIYGAAKIHHLHPHFAPLLKSDEDLLVVPDERDATWIELDGRDALIPLARISAVQFTIEVERESAVQCLNALGEKVADFVADYPQEEVWRKYISTSKAGYDPLRYGGPLRFENMANYCRKLAQHEVVQGTKLVPLHQVSQLNIPLFIRSVWWYFRLKRYGDRLCIEVRPLPRREDKKLEEQLKVVLDAMNL